MRISNLHIVKMHIIDNTAEILENIHFGHGIFCPIHSCIRDIRKMKINIFNSKFIPKMHNDKLKHKKLFGFLIIPLNIYHIIFITKSSRIGVNITVSPSSLGISGKKETIVSSDSKCIIRKSKILNFLTIDSNHKIPSFSISHTASGHPDSRHNYE